MNLFSSHFIALDYTSFRPKCNGCAYGQIYAWIQPCTKPTVLSLFIIVNWVAIGFTNALASVVLVVIHCRQFMVDPHLIRKMVAMAIVAPAKRNVQEYRHIKEILVWTLGEYAITYTVCVYQICYSIKLLKRQCPTHAILISIELSPN